ncbi:MAG: hypothetical protein BWK80_04545 [Desulfobacteraceae bacterium IS3]|nr:MAG: hypothetical protein BWK80_04545 [Desulfobacteraceae bacterium IS3]
MDKLLHFLIFVYHKLYISSLKIVFLLFVFSVMLNIFQILFHISDTQFLQFYIQNHISGIYSFLYPRFSTVGCFLRAYIITQAKPRKGWSGAEPIVSECSAGYTFTFSMTHII